MGKGNKRNIGKLKHYNHSFYTGGRRTKKIIGMVVLLVALFLLGWLAGPAVIDFGTGLWYDMKNSHSQAESGMQPGEPSALPLPEETAAPTAEPTEVPTAEPTAGPTDTPSAEPSAEPTATPTPKPTAKPTAKPETDPGEGGWSFVSVTAAKNAEQAAKTAAQLAEKGVKYAVLPFKDDQGHVYYESKVAAAQAGLSSTTYDAAAAAAAFKKEGIIPVASIAVFRDATAAGADRSMAVLYKDSDYLWLDRAREKGGKPWLNPASPAAVGYISDLIQEAKSLGYEQIWLTDLQFPTASGRQKATFSGMGDRSIPQVLADALKQFNQLADCWVEVSMKEALKGTESAVLGAKPAELGIKRLVLRSDEAPNEEKLAEVVADAKAGGAQIVALLEGSSFTLQ